MNFDYYFSQRIVKANSLYSALAISYMCYLNLNYLKVNTIKSSVCQLHVSFFKCSVATCD